MSISTPAGVSSAAMRRRRVLYESARRLPEMARRRMELLLHQLELDEEGDVVAKDLLAVRQVHVPANAVLVAVNCRPEGEGDALAADWISQGAAICARGLDRLGLSGDGQLTAEGDYAVADGEVV